MRSGSYRYRSTPQATVAMVTYNSGKFVRAAIESVLAQDFDDFELVICDDGSSDDTWAIVKSFGDRRIRAIRNERNLGEYPNRNKILDLARGTYLMYLDGDDLLYPHGLGLMVKTLARFPHAGYASAMGPCEKFVYPVELTAHQFCACAYFGPNVLTNDFTQLFFRTEALRALGGFDLRYRSGDTHVQFALGMRCNVVLMAAGMAWWRRRPGQASEALKGTGESLREMWAYCRELLEHPQCPLDERERAIARENMSRLVLRGAVRMLLRGKVRPAFRVALGSGIPAADYRSLFTAYDKSFLSEVSGENPVHLRIAGHAAPAPASRRRLPPHRLDFGGIAGILAPPLRASLASRPEMRIDVRSVEAGSEVRHAASHEPV